MDVRHICLTHMHGDHCFGLPGLLEALTLLKRAQPVAEVQPIYVYGPPGVFDFVQVSLQVSCAIPLTRCVVGGGGQWMR